jgi:hypothetical protein
MASQVLSGSSNPTYTNNTGQNVRIVINFMSSTTSGEITINWAGVSVTQGNIEAIGKNIASASGFYGDFGFSGFAPFGWWKRINQVFSPATSLGTQNLSVRFPGSSTTIDVDFGRKGWKRFFRDGSTTEITSFSFAVAFPIEIFLSPNQTFSAICGVYNIVAIPEAG